MNGYICRVITHPTYLFKASKIQPYEKKVVLQDPQEVGESCRIIGVGLNQPVGNLLKCGVYQQIPSETNQHSHGKCSMLMVSTGKDGGFSHGYVRLAEVIMSQMAPQLERFTPKKRGSLQIIQRRNQVGSPWKGVSPTNFNGIQKVLKSWTVGVWWTICEDFWGEKPWHFDAFRSNLWRQQNERC